MSKKMIYEFTEAQEKQMNEIKKYGVINDLDVSNKNKILTLALKLATEKKTK